MLEQGTQPSAQSRASRRLARRLDRLGLLTLQAECLVEVDCLSLKGEPKALGLLQLFSWQLSGRDWLQLQG